MRSSSVRVPAWRFVLALGVGWGSLLAQVNTGSITGVALDSSGAAVPGVAVEIKNLGTGVALTTATNEYGIYLAQALVPGQYSVTGSAAGFQTVTFDKVEIRVGDRLTLNLTMNVSGVTEQVTVTAEAPLVESAHANLGGVIDYGKLQAMALPNRNVINLARLVPGVVPSEGTDPNTLTAGGGRPNQVSYYIDGVPSTSNRGTEIVAPPRLEAIDEFRVETNNLSAEYGRLSGGALNISTRSGTNEYHGSAYWYYRDQSLNAESWTNKLRGQKAGSQHDHNYGFTIGGPVLIPKLYDGRNRTFFFVNIDRVYDIALGSPRTLTVPTELERTGDFSRSVVNTGNPSRIFDPFSVNDTTGDRTAFPGSVIPKSLVDPIAMRAASFYPTPNRAAEADGLNNLIVRADTLNKLNNLVFRADQNLNDNHRFYFRGTINYLDNRPEGVFGVATNGRWVDKRDLNGSFNYNWTVSPTSILNVSVGATRDFRNDRPPSNETYDYSAFPWPANLGDKMDPDFFPNFAGTRWTSIGQTWLTRAPNYRYRFAPTFTKIAGNHTIKFGYQMDRIYANFEDTEAPTSASTFTRYGSRSNALRDLKDDTGDENASMMLGVIDKYRFTQVASTATGYINHGVWFNDDWKVTSKLTLNLGLRWEYEAPPTERFDRNWSWHEEVDTGYKINPGWSFEKDAAPKLPAGVPVPNLSGPALGQPLRVASPGHPERYTWKRDLNNFFPRLGAAFQMNSKTTIRGGFGIIGQGYTGRGSGPDGTGGHLFSAANGTVLQAGVLHPVTISNPFPNNAGLLPLTNDPQEIKDRIAGLTFSGYANTGSDRMPHEYSFNIGVQRELPGRSVVEVSYAGLRGRDIQGGFHYQIAALPREYLSLGKTLNTQVPNPWYGSNMPITVGNNGIHTAKTVEYQQLLQRITHMNPRGFPGVRYFYPNTSETWYDALWVRFEKRYSAGFALQANYTYARADDSTTSPIDGRDEVIRMRTAFNRRHTFAGAATWDLPVGRGRKYMGSPAGAGEKILEHIVGGWQTSLLTTWMSGLPLRVTQNLQTLPYSWNASAAIANPRRIGDDFRTDLSPKESAHTGTTPTMLDKSAFEVVGPFQIGDDDGTLPGISGPAFMTNDIAVQKRFDIYERIHLRFVVQGTNMLNQVNLQNPQLNVNNARFGVISAAYEPRRLQFGLKLVF